MKIVLAKGPCSFQLSQAAISLLWKRGIDFRKIGSHNRTSPALVEIVEALGDDAGNKLRVIEIPDDVEWTLDIEQGRDGCTERVIEKHRVWTTSGLSSC